MSRSYKKFPIVRQEQPDRRRANRFVRHNIDFEMPKHGTHFKKIPNTRGSRWAYYWSIEDAKRFYKRNVFLQKKYTLEEYLIWYKKTVISK